MRRSAYRHVQAPPPGAGERWLGAGRRQAPDIPGLAMKIAVLGAGTIVAAEAHTLPGSVADLLPLLDASTPVIFAVNGLPWRYFHKHRLSPIACLTLATGKEVAETPVLCDLFARCISETGSVPKRLMCKSTSSRGRAACGRRRTGRRCSRICLPASLWRSMCSRSQHRSGRARQFDIATPTLDLLLALLPQRAGAATRRSLPGA